MNRNDRINMIDITGKLETIQNALIDLANGIEDGQPIIRMALTEQIEALETVTRQLMGSEVKR